MATGNEQRNPFIPKAADEITYRSTSSAAPHPETPPMGTVVSETWKKKKKRKYSSGLKGLQGLERGLTKSLGTVSDGLAKMYEVYNDRRDKSAGKKKDGALRDGLENWTKAMSKGMRIASNGPYDFVKAVNGGGGSKKIRKTIRLLLPPPLR
jgi:hypothetical protein